MATRDLISSRKPASLVASTGLQPMIFDYEVEAAIAP
jgi:hypothetical protein